MKSVGDVAFAEMFKEARSQRPCLETCREASRGAAPWCPSNPRRMRNVQLEDPKRSLSEVFQKSFSFLKYLKRLFFLLESDFSFGDAFKTGFSCILLRLWSWITPIWAAGRSLCARRRPCDRMGTRGVCKQGKACKARSMQVARHGEVYKREGGKGSQTATAWWVRKLGLIQSMMDVLQTYEWSVLSTGNDAVKVSRTQKQRWADWKTDKCGEQRCERWDCSVATWSKLSQTCSLISDNSTCEDRSTLKARS